MAFANVAKLGAGTKLYFEDPANPGTYLLLDNALSLGQVGEQGEFVQITPISKTVHEFIKGMTTPPNKQITFNDVPGDANYKKLLDAVDSEATDSINMRVDYATNTRAQFTIVPNGRVMDEPQGNAQLQMIIFGQQSGSTAWSEI